MAQKVEKSDSEWAKQLTPQQYAILRGKATEASFSGEYDSTFDQGTYRCAACGSELFASKTKFEAHCGWPSFYDSIPCSVEFHDDTRMDVVRTEVTCATCGGHLGHVFKGEELSTPIDQRYCINSLSLRFTPDNN